MTNQTAAEIRQEYLEKIGEPLGLHFYQLWQAVAQIHVNWGEYVELFGSKPARVDLLNQAAPAFFRMIQDEFFESCLLHLTRLTDPPKSPGRSGRKNLTIQILPALIDDDLLREEAKRLIANAVEQTKFARDWRNRHIAHRDLDLVLQQPTTELASATRLQVRASLQAIADVMNAVQSHYMDCETRFDLVNRIEGAESLLFILNAGVEAQKARVARVAKGDFSKADLDCPDI